MTLCGVLKNILLVVGAIVVWGTIVGGLQTTGVWFQHCPGWVTILQHWYDGVVVYYSKLRDLKEVFFKTLVYFLFSL